MVIKNNMANPEGTQAREPYKNFDGGRSLPGINYIPLPEIGEGLGEWSEALLAKRVG